MNTKYIVSQITKAAAIAAVLAMSSQAHALAFVNGGFEGYTGDTNTWNSAVPPGWTTTSGTPDTFDANTTMWGFTWAPSSTGGDSLHGLVMQPSWTASAEQLSLEVLVFG